MRRSVCLTAALEAAALEGKLVRNVARLVKPPEHTPRERDTWSKAEVRRFLAKVSSDRLDWYQGGECVITDRAGTPIHPEWYSDEFRRLLRRAGTQSQGLANR